MNINYYTGVTSAFAAGTIVGMLAVRGWLEVKLRAARGSEVESMQRAYEMALDDIRERTPIESIDGDPEGHGQAMQDAKESVMMPDELDDLVYLGTLPENKNEYHRTLSEVETPQDLFVSGGVNDYGVSYIEEEEYQEEDGRLKERVDILMDGTQPIFLVEGEQIEDWDSRLGDSILVDFYKLVPPGVDRILYVRNHQTNIDYEVVQVSP